MDNAPDVRIVNPFYPQIKQADLKVKPAASFKIAHTQGPLHIDVHESVLYCVPFYLIDSPPVADSDVVYSGDNYRDGTKFFFFLCQPWNSARS